MQQQQQFLIDNAHEFFGFFQDLAYEQFNNEYHADVWDEVPHPVRAMGKVLDYIDEIMTQASEDEDVRKQTLIEAIFSAGKRFYINTERIVFKFIEDPQYAERVLKQ